jgi:phosphatidylinositol alpha-1,6-mannosyltransferase
MVQALGALRRQARHEDVDVVLFSSMVTASLSVLLRGVFRRHGVRTAAIVHGLDVTTPARLYQWFVPRVFEALDAVLPVSRATGAACLERGLPPEKLHVVPNGVQLDRFPPLDDRATMRRALTAALPGDGPPLPPSALLLCSVGRHVKRKGFAWFADEVMPRLPGDVHYWIGGAEGPETPHIKAAIEQRGLAGRVRLLGRISEEELEKLYRGADLFVMPNIPVPGDMEGFGVVMLEAGLCGLPTIAARLEGIQDVITEGENGHFVESGDGAGFAGVINRYHQDAALLAAASRRAAEHTAARFGWPAVAGQYLQVLRTL